MEYAEWLEMEREILARDRAAFTGERPLAGWEIDGRKQYADIDTPTVGRFGREVQVPKIGKQEIIENADGTITIRQMYGWETARETH